MQTAVFLAQLYSERDITVVRHLYLHNSLSPTHDIILVSASSSILPLAHSHIISLRRIVRTEWKTSPCQSQTITSSLLVIRTKRISL